MRAKELFEIAKAVTKLSQKKIAEITDFPEQSIGQKIVIRETVKFNEFMYIMNKIGMEAVFFNKEKNVIIAAKEGWPKEIQTPDDVEFVPYDKNGENPVWDIMKSMIRIEGVRFSIVEKKLGYTVQILEYKTMRRGSIKANEFFDVCRGLGYDVIFYYTENGRILQKMTKREKGPRVKGMADKVIYDTDEATLISSSFWAEGHEYGEDGKAQDLYIDPQGRYFLAEYSNDGEKPKIRYISANVRKAFINQYGLVEDRNE